MFWFCLQCRLWTAQWNLHCWPVDGRISGAQPLQTQNQRVIKPWHCAKFNAVHATIIKLQFQCYAIFVDSTTVRSASKTRRVSLEYCHVTASGTVDFNIESIVVEMKLCDAPAVYYSRTLLVTDRDWQQQQIHSIGCIRCICKFAHPIMVFRDSRGPATQFFGAGGYYSASGIVIFCKDVQSALAWPYGLPQWPFEFGECN